MYSDEELSKLIEDYLNLLTDDERKAMQIAKEQLKTSFNLEKSIGFLNYLKSIGK